MIGSSACSRMPGYEKTAIGRLDYIKSLVIACQCAISFLESGTAGIDLRRRTTGDRGIGRFLANSRPVGGVEPDIYMILSGSKRRHSHIAGLVCIRLIEYTRPAAVENLHTYDGRARQSRNVDLSIAPGDAYRRTILCNREG